MQLILIVRETMQSTLLIYVWVLIKADCVLKIIIVMCKFSCLCDCQSNFIKQCCILVWCYMLWTLKLCHG